MSFVRPLNAEDRRRFADTDCQQELSRLVRGEPEGDACRERIAYIYRYRHLAGEQWREWPLCELHMQKVLEAGAQMTEG